MSLLEMQCYTNIIKYYHLTYIMLIYFSVISKIEIENFHLLVIRKFILWLGPKLNHYEACTCQWTCSVKFSVCHFLRLFSCNTYFYLLP